MSFLLQRVRSNSTTLRVPFSCLRSQSPSVKYFSVQPDQPLPSSTIDPFLRTTGEGVAYGKLFGINKHTLKTDIVNLLEGCNLHTDDIKISYNNNYNPLAMTIQFSSAQSFENAIKVIGRKGRLYRLEKSDRSQWDPIMPYDGKTAVLHGIPINAFPEDVERFLSGCEFDSSSIRMLMRPGLGFTKLASVRFLSRGEAMNALITKNRGFCLNNQISVQVLQ
ncbi:uncharacterized protein LOC126677430 [Mercurialis annua]|uniref:uncharacterized protein LOC126677430 n=1 Tax=Mercurialis annua TaxID=3986 RepID=UPI00215F6D06|nr:uncharacterized protein LOC126677430 [Mercurialis annua]